jgi:hypothetical protein
MGFDGFPGQIEELKRLARLGLDAERRSRRQLVASAVGMMLIGAGGFWLGRRSAASDARGLGEAADPSATDRTAFLRSRLPLARKLADASDSDLRASHATFLSILAWPPPRTLFGTASTDWRLWQYRPAIPTSRAHSCRLRRWPICRRAAEPGSNKCESRRDEPRAEQRGQSSTEPARGRTSRHHHRLRAGAVLCQPRSGRRHRQIHPRRPRRDRTVESARLGGSVVHRLELR